MKASETTLRNLLEGGKQFQIPLFQRPYSWKKDNWETLWEDLMSLYNDEVQDFYFLGSIVTQATLGTADGVSLFFVIDGQQRLTTLTIILAALRNHLKEINSQIADELYELYLINKFKKDNDFYKVLPTQDDREIYKSIIQNKQDIGIERGGKIFEAYQFFYDRLRNPDIDGEISFDYAKFKIILLERLMLVNITSDDKDNPYLIFESLNNKGQELTQADLVRNYIFMQLPPDRQEDLYREEWLPLQEQFKNNACQKGYVEQLTNAFWFHLRKDGKSINQKEVYKKIKEQFDKSEIGVQHELKSLIKSAKYYQRFNFKNQENIPKLNCYFQRFLRLDFTTCQIFLLNVYQEFEQKKLSLEDFEKILQYLESYFVRRWLAGVPTRSLGNVFNKLYNQVKANNPHDLVSGLREVLLSFTGNQVWSDDDSFRHGIINQAVYTKTSNDRVKLFLERIEESLSGKELVNFQNLSIEHIMPQNLTEDWQIMLEENYDSIHKKWLHTLGNLTLTGYNSELSNRSFEEKLSQIGNFSNITLNKYYLQKQVEIWNEEAIKNRAEYLANIAVKVWSR